MSLSKAKSQKQKQITKFIQSNHEKKYCQKKLKKKNGSYKEHNLLSVSQKVISVELVLILLRCNHIRSILH